MPSSANSSNVMDNTEYTEYMEERNKTKIKLGNAENEYFEEDEEIKSEKTENKEYFEDDIKSEIEETVQTLQLGNFPCDICQRVFKTKAYLFHIIARAQHGIEQRRRRSLF